MSGKKLTFFCCSWHTRVFFNMMKKVCTYLHLDAKKEDKREWKLGKILSQFNLHCMKVAILSRPYILAYSTIALFHVYLSWKYSAYTCLVYFNKIRRKKNMYMMNSTFFSLEAVYILVTELYVPEREKYLKVCDARSSKQTYK